MSTGYLLQFVTVENKAARGRAASFFAITARLRRVGKAPFLLMARN
jgi:hypothetical protein